MALDFKRTPLNKDVICLRDQTSLGIPGVTCMSKGPKKDELCKTTHIVTVNAGGSLGVLRFYELLGYEGKEPGSFTGRLIYNVIYFADAVSDEKLAEEVKEALDYVPLVKKFVEPQPC